MLFCSSPLTFDIAVLTVLLSLRTGAKLIMNNDPKALAADVLDGLQSAGVTHIQVSLSIVLLPRCHCIATISVTHCGKDRSVVICCK